MKIIKNIPIFDIELKKREKKYVKNCLQNSEIGQGHYVNKFEEKFSSFVECKFGVSTTSGTTALHLACAAIGLKDKDEVLVSSSTNMATAFAAEYCGAIPIPIDIDINTWQINVYQIERKINKKTKAIIVVHLFGHPVDMDPVIKLAKKYNLKIIEDCAEAHGVTYKGKKVGSLGDVGVFSFYPNKTITCGEGGMLVTNSKKIALKAFSLKNLSYGKINRFMHEDIGFNYRMPNISAAIGLGQLDGIKEIFFQKKRIYNRYKKNLINIKGVNIPEIKPWAGYIMWVFNLYIDKSFPINRDQLVKKLLKNKIETRNAFVPVNQQKVFLKKYNFINKRDCPNANFIMRNGFYLPSGNNLTNREIDYICKIIKKIAKLK